MRLIIDISDQTFAALEKALQQIQTHEPGGRPGQVVIRPVFPNAVSWLHGIIAQHINQHVPDQPDGEVQALIDQADELRKRAAEMSITRRAITVSVESASAVIAR